MKYKSKKKDCYLLIKAKSSRKEKIDEKELTRFKREYMRGFFKADEIKKNSITYMGPVSINLYDRLKNNLNKKDFLYILMHLVVCVKKLNSKRLPIRNLALDLRQVYINDSTKELQFLYVPIVNNSAIVDISQFIEAIVYSANPCDQNDPDYIQKFIYFFRGMKTLDLDKIENYILKQDKDIVNTINKYTTRQSGSISSSNYNDDLSVDLPVDDLLTGLLIEEDDDLLTGSLTEEDDELLTGSLTEEDDDLLTGPLTEEDDDLLTEKNDEDELEINYFDVSSKQHPSIVRISTNETILINKPVFRIGKERSYVDYFVKNNESISRGHADIITRGDVYFVIDRNSLNKTYINNIKLKVDVEEQIKNGDSLRLANEEFIFYLKT